MSKSKLQMNQRGKYKTQLPDENKSESIWNLCKESISVIWNLVL